MTYVSFNLVCIVQSRLTYLNHDLPIFMTPYLYFLTNCLLRNLRHRSLPQILPSTPKRILFSKCYVTSERGLERKQLFRKPSTYILLQVVHDLLCNSPLTVWRVKHPKSSNVTHFGTNIVVIAITILGYCSIAFILPTAGGGEVHIWLD